MANTKKIQQKNGNVDDVLKMMGRANESFNYEIFIPSLNRNVMFRELTTSQQKRLIKAIIDSPAYNTEFIFTFKQIIKENCVDENVDLSKLNIYDKLMIALTMRSVSIGNDLSVTFTSPATQKPYNIKIEISDIIKQLKEISVNQDIVKFTDDKGVFTVHCGIPTIDDEFKLENEVRRNTSQLEIKNENELRKIVGDVFIGEIVKYVKQIDFKGEENTIVEIDFAPLEFVKRIALVEKLPAKSIKDIIHHISSIEKEFEKVFLLKTTIKEDDKEEILEQRLKIDASFFTIS